MNIRSLFLIPRWRGLWYYLLNNHNSSPHLTIHRPLIFSNFCIKWLGHVFIQANARIEGVTRYESVAFSPLIIINDGVSIQQNCHITCAERITIGENTAIASNVTITDINHPYEDINTPIERQPITVCPVSIDRDCKIYNNAVILQGVHIGKHCVVGANSIVTKDVPDYCVVAGIPAKIIKRYNFKNKRWEKTRCDGTFITNKV